MLSVLTPVPHDVARAFPQAGPRCCAACGGVSVQGVSEAG